MLNSKNKDRAQAHLSLPSFAAAVPELPPAHHWLAEGWSIASEPGRADAGTVLSTTGGGPSRTAHSGPNSTDPSRAAAPESRPPLFTSSSLQPVHTGLHQRIFPRSK